MNDLNIIKKYYGEKMMHMCRSFFPTLLEIPGLLSKIMLDNFYPNKFLYEDIDISGNTGKFKNYIYKVSELIIKKPDLETDVKKPEELLLDVGYSLYKCETEEDIQSFRKYYKKNEELCTFSTNRLNNCFVFFAVKKNVDEIKRKEKPERQDEYGTSVISVQFSKDKSRTLSIKNRYNHNVSNPDATFSNNLDNIVEGLTDSFKKHYGMKQAHLSEFEMFGYVKADDGKYYKYNCEINNIYYCTSNIIIDNFKVLKEKSAEKERYMLIDYFLIDLKEKKIMLYDKKIQDSFIESCKEILKIEVLNIEEGKKIKITNKNKEGIFITVNKYNQITEYVNKNVKEIKDNFLRGNKVLKNIELPQVQTIGNNFLCYNEVLEKIELPQIQTIGNNFLRCNEVLEKIELPQAQTIGDFFLESNKVLEKIELPQVQTIGNNFLCYNEVLEKIELPQAQTIGDIFLCYNKVLEKIELPQVQTIGSSFLCYNNVFEKIELPQVQTIGINFLRCNEVLEKIELPQAQTIEDFFLTGNKFLEKIELPQAQTIGSSFLCYNRVLKNIELPQVQTIGNNFLRCNEVLEKIELPQAQTIGSFFLKENKSLICLYLPQVKDIGKSFLSNNNSLVYLNLSKLQNIGKGFLLNNFPCCEEIEKQSDENNSCVRTL
ncbi:MAG: hypothetical protein GX641_02150 [Mollicutes bacterium]|nr:hypothetical protein [Mollicutes bacterium]